MKLLAGIALVLAQTAQGPPLPYTAIHQPEFVTAAEAAFLEDDDIVLGVASGSIARAYPAADLAQHGAVSDKMPDGPISVTNDDASSLIDRETRSTWNAYGLALEGPMKGTQLEQVILVPQFWFAWSQFRPGTRVFTVR